MIVTLSIPGEPRGKARPRFFARKGGGIGNYNDTKTASYENLVKFCAQEQFHEALWEGPVRVSIKAYFSAPKSTKKSLLAYVINELLYCIKKPDVDNIAKITCDALNKVVYHDDAQVAELIVSKRYSKTPRVEIVIIKLPLAFDPEDK